VIKLVFLPLFLCIKREKAAQKEKLKKGMEYPLLLFFEKSKIPLDTKYYA